MFKFIFQIYIPNLYSKFINIKMIYIYKFEYYLIIVNDRYN